MKEDDGIGLAVEQFRRQYPGVGSADLQTFILGWQAAINETTRVFEFVYNPNCSESAIATLSIHKTLKGAQMALDFHKAEKMEKWEIACEENKFNKDFPFDYDQYWGIIETDLVN